MLKLLQLALAAVALAAKVCVYGGEGSDQVQAYILLFV